MAFLSAPALSITSRRRLSNRCVVRATTSPPKKVRPDVTVDAPSEYNDGPFAQFCISTFRRIMRPHIGWQSPRSGYDGLVEECRMLLVKKGAKEQQEVVFHTLNTLFQAPQGSQAFRKYFSDKAQLNSMITPIFFKWLVGECYNNKPEEGGYGVYIEKCRFLEQSGCKGLCVNMCQQPTQNYFTNELGLPVRMTPNYEDNSCQMTFGVKPLPIHEDPAVTGDCLVNCKMSSSIRDRGDKTCYVTKEP